YERWWQAIVESSFAELDGVFVHPVYDDQVMAGNGTIGLEILEDLPQADAVLIPFGGGGLSVGIASALKALRPEAQVYAIEPETGAPLTASLAAGEPRKIDYEPSFVDGSGSPAVLPRMWELAHGLLDGAAAVPIAESAAAVRLLAERARVVAEGAGALSLAAEPAGLADAGVGIGATKADDVEAAAAQLEGSLGAGTVMTVQNGLGAEQVVRSHGAWPQLSAVTFMSGTKLADDHVEYVLDTPTW